MGLKQQRNFGYGLLAYGIYQMTGFSLSAYGQGVLFLLVVLLTAIILGFLTMKEAVALKASNAEIPFVDAVKVTGSFFFLIFLGCIVVTILGIIKGF